MGFVHSSLLNNPGRTSHELMHITDWFPTLVEGVAGGSLNGTQLDGYNQWPMIRFSTTICLYYFAFLTYLFQHLSYVSSVLLVEKAGIPVSMVLTVLMLWLK